MTGSGQTKDSDTEASAASVRAYALWGPTESGDIGDLLSELPPKEGRLRLQALLAEWLRMENLVVLTGAGTSLDIGGSTLAQLERAVLKAVAATPSLPQSLAALIGERLKPINGRPEWARGNFENWLTYLSNGRHIIAAADSPIKGVEWQTSPQPTADEINALVKLISAGIRAECALRVPSPTSGGLKDIPPHLAFLSKLTARDSTLGRAHLFTMNYDTAFEQALETLGIQYFDGFTGRADARFEPSVYGLDLYYPGEVAEGRVRRFEKFMHLYKLHGSIHWRDDAGTLRARHPDLTLFEAYRASSNEEKAAMLTAGTFADLEPLGILPTSNKFVQTLDAPFAHLFRSFQIRLAQPQTFLLVAGYGFGDEHVNQIIEAALTNPSLVMLVVEPNADSETVTNRIFRYKELGKRAFVLTATKDKFSAAPFTVATFADFAKVIMPDVQWLSDFMRLRKFETQIRASKPQRDENEIDPWTPANLTRG